MEARILKGVERIGKEDVKMAEKVVEMKGTEAKMEDKMKSTMDKIGKGAKVFGAGFVKQVTNVETIASSVGVGAYQGFKYNGSVERGVKAGLSYLGIMGALNGITRVVQNWDTITED